EIIRTARETLARLDEKERVDRWNERNRDDGREDALEHWDRLKQRSEEPKLNRRHADDLTDAQRAEAWQAWVDQQIAARIAAEREFMLQVIGEALAEYVHRSNKKAKGELDDVIRPLRIEIAEQNGVLAELRRSLAAENAKIIDLPGSPLRPRSNV